MKLLSNVIALLRLRYFSKNSALQMETYNEKYLKGTFSVVIFCCMLGLFIVYNIRDYGVMLSVFLIRSGTNPHNTGKTWNRYHYYQCLFLSCL